MSPRIAAGGLFLLGLLQMAGDLTGIQALKGIGAATVASPAPKVFSAVKGFETYSTRFFLEYRDRQGQAQSVEITSERYSHLRVPYNRRNIYGAALAYGPVMPAELRDPVMRFALCGKRPILKELGIDPEDIVGAVTVRFEPRPGTDLGTLPRTLQARCEAPP
ncbi:MAG TPA: hypothetical protein VH208_05525 [Myxococcaceae bacterium]|nr:hypothetical protein [Myxococcaceae bacterium]